MQNDSAICESANPVTSPTLRRVLIAEDDPPSRLRLKSMLGNLGYEVVTANDGDQAWNVLSEPTAPHMTVLDWEMPGMTGPELVRRLRKQATQTSAYVLLLTSRVGTDNIVAGLEAGANDYLIKPYNREELHARLQVGFRVLDLQASLTLRVRELELALNEVQRLQGLLPVCAWCKKVRDGKEYWTQLEDYFTAHAGVKFTHAMCPDCWHTQTGLPSVNGCGHHATLEAQRD